jgi:preprotein translocase subunit SecE
MAKRDEDEDDRDEAGSDEPADGDRPSADGEGDDEREDDAEGDDAEGDEPEGDDAAEPGASKALARRSPADLEVGDDVGALAGEGPEGVLDEEHAVHQMGAQRYVIAAFIVATMTGAYVLGLTIHGVWAWASNRDFFALRVPALAAVADESKLTYGTIIGAFIALAYAVKQYRDPEVRTWTDDVASELTKVKWPTKKDVTNSTIVVIAASAFAMLYLFLLDRLWGFVTSLIYGAGT